jgi:predicted phage tail protein
MLVKIGLIMTIKLVFKKLWSRKDVINTIEAIKRWKISDPKFKKETINDWEKIDIPNWKKKN